jgi:hypothetical protein
VRPLSFLTGARYLLAEDDSETSLGAGRKMRRTGAVRRTTESRVLSW